MFLKIIATFFILSNPWLILVNQPAGLATNSTELATANLADVSQAPLSTYKLPLSTYIQAYDQAQANPDFLPIRNWSVGEPEITVKAGIVFDTDRDRILWKKNIDDVLPVASLTKLMTGLIVIENMKLDRVVNVSQEAYQAPGYMGGLRVNEKIAVKTLLYAMLMESSNDAAMALAEAKGPKDFLRLMNQKAQAIGMMETSFVEPSGYEPGNVSTINDLIKFIKFSSKYPLLWQITSTRVIDLHSADGQYDHHFVNNNKLLSRLEHIVGGKTGYTNEAGGCMVLVINQSSQGNLIIIILGAENRILATEKLVDWINQAYIW